MQGVTLPPTPRQYDVVCPVLNVTHSCHLWAYYPLVEVLLVVLQILCEQVQLSHKGIRLLLHANFMPCSYYYRCRSSVTRLRQCISIVLHSINIQLSRCNSALYRIKSTLAKIVCQDTQRYCLLGLAACKVLSLKHKSMLPLSYAFVKREFDLQGAVVCWFRAFRSVLLTPILKHVQTKKSNIYINVCGVHKTSKPLKIQGFPRT